MLITCLLYFLIENKKEYTFLRVRNPSAKQNTMTE